jgi:hypothetical protein
MKTIGSMTALLLCLAMNTAHAANLQLSSTTNPQPATVALVNAHLAASSTGFAITLNLNERDTCQLDYSKADGPMALQMYALVQQSLGNSKATLICQGATERDIDGMRVVTLSMSTTAGNSNFYINTTN